MSLCYPEAQKKQKHLMARVFRFDNIDDDSLQSLQEDEFNEHKFTDLDGPNQD